MECGEQGGEEVDALRSLLNHEPDVNDVAQLPQLSEGLNELGSMPSEASLPAPFHTSPQSGENSTDTASHEPVYSHSSDCRERCDNGATMPLTPSSDPHEHNAMCSTHTDGTSALQRPPNCRHKQRRMRWSPELHALFVQAVNALGGTEYATPKAILQHMNVAGLTLSQVKSHLQKYRYHEQRMSRQFHHLKQQEAFHFVPSTSIAGQPNCSSDEHNWLAPCGRETHDTLQLGQEEQTPYSSCSRGSESEHQRKQERRGDQVNHPFSDKPRTGASAEGMVPPILPQDGAGEHAEAKSKHFAHTDRELNKPMETLGTREIVEDNNEVNAPVDNNSAHGSAWCSGHITCSKRHIHGEWTGNEQSNLFEENANERGDNGNVHAERLPVLEGGREHGTRLHTQPGFAQFSSIEEALQKQMEMQAQLHQHIEAQRKLQAAILEHGKCLEQMMNQPQHLTAAAPMLLPSSTYVMFPDGDWKQHENLWQLHHNYIQQQQEGHTAQQVQQQQRSNVVETEPDQGQKRKKLRRKG